MYLQSIPVLYVLHIYTVYLLQYSVSAGMFKKRLSLCRCVCGFPSANTPATVVLHPKQPGKGTYANVQTCYFVIVSCSVRQGKDGWLWMEAAAASSPP